MSESITITPFAAMSAMPVHVPPDLIEEITGYIGSAWSGGRREDVMRVWREFARVVLALCVRSRGWHIGLAGTCTVVLPRDSTCSILGKTCGLAGRVPLDPVSVAQLRQLSRADTGDDVAMRCAHSLSRGVLEAERLPPAEAREITAHLLHCVAASAAEFQASAPRTEAMPTAAPGEPEVEMAAWILFQSPRSRIDQEVQAALDYCMELARVLLVRKAVREQPGAPMSEVDRMKVDKDMDCAIGLQRKGFLLMQDGEFQAGEATLRQASTLFRECGRMDAGCGWEAGVIASLLPLVRRTAPKEAIAMLSEATDLCRPAAHRGEECAEAYALAMGDLGYLCEDSDTALAATLEGFQVLWPLFLCNPSRFAQNLTGLYQLHRQCCEKSGRPLSDELSRAAPIYASALVYEIVDAHQKATP